MATCLKCGNELADGAKFCGRCGTQIPAAAACPICGAPIVGKAAFCRSCGAALAEKDAEQPLAKAAEAEKKPVPKAIIFGGIAAAILAVFVVTIALFFVGGRKSNDNYALYLKDDELFFTDLKKNSKPWQLTSDFAGNGNVNMDGTSISMLAYTSKDGRYIFFVDKMDNKESFNLYCRELEKPESEALKIDSDIVWNTISCYEVNTSATLVTYCKEGGALYQYKIKEETKDKIAASVQQYEVSDDGKGIIYLDDEMDIYVYAEQNKEKIASGVDSIVYISEDLGAVYYTKDDALYRWLEGTGKEKIISGVDSIVHIYDSGEIYYVTCEDREIKWKDYITDDMKVTDAAIVAPKSPTYPAYPERPSRYEYNTSAKYERAYEAYEKEYKKVAEERKHLDDVYQTALEEYYNKTIRDAIREELEEKTTAENYSLYFFNGTEKIRLADTVSELTIRCSYKNLPVVSYKAADEYPQGIIKFSELWKIVQSEETDDDYEELLKDRFVPHIQAYIAVRDKATAIAHQDITQPIVITPFGTAAYYMDNLSEDGDRCELYRVLIDSGIVGTPELYDSEIFPACFYGDIDDYTIRWTSLHMHMPKVNDKDCWYFKDYKNDLGDLYVNQEKIDYDVHPGNLAVDPYGSGKMIYFTDWNEEKQCGVLKLYRNGKAQKIADDVHDWVMLPDGRVLYLCDYSLKYNTGELREWDDGETRRIDEDVTGLITPWSAEWRSLFRETIYSFSV